MLPPFAMAGIADCARRVLAKKFRLKRRSHSASSSSHPVLPLPLPRLATRMSSRDGGGDGLRVGKVAGGFENLRRRIFLAQSGGCLRERCGVAAGDADACALREQCGGDGPADAA